MSPSSSTRSSAQPKRATRSRSRTRSRPSTTCSQRTPPSTAPNRKSSSASCSPTSSPPHSTRPSSAPGPAWDARARPARTPSRRREGASGFQIRSSREPGDRLRAASSARCRRTATDLDPVDLRIDDESQYVDAAVALSEVNAQPYSHGRLALAPAGRPPLRPRRGRPRPSPACWRGSTMPASTARCGSRGARGSCRGRADRGAGPRASAKSSASAARSSRWPVSSRSPT